MLSTLARALLGLVTGSCLVAGIQHSPRSVNGTNTHPSATGTGLSTSTGAPMSGTAHSPWNAVHGDDVVKNLTGTFAANGAICPQCLGVPLSECKSANPSGPSYDVDCTRGLRDIAGGRFDTAAARFAYDTELDDLQCAVETGSCTGAPSCQDCNGPGTYVVLKSLETLNNLMNNVYNAIRDARDACTNDITQFSKDFAPIPELPSADKWIALLSSFAGGVSGIPGIESPALNFAVSLSAAVGSMVLDTSPPAPADPGSYLGVMANSSLSAVANVTDQIFTNGNATWPKAADGSTNLQLTDMTAEGALLLQQSTNTSLYNTLVPIYQRSLYQQLAVYTWQHLEALDHQSGSTVNIPFITFEHGNCGATTGPFLTGRDMIMDDFDRTATQVGIDGNCYYLLDARPFKNAPTTLHSGGGGGHLGRRQSGMTCNGGNTLPGGSNALLTGASATYAGLTLADFVVPSVRAWQANKNQNGWAAASSTGAVITDLQQASVTTLPVCDYLGNNDKPGKGCPKLLDKYQGCTMYTS